jgi:predicted DNA-binding WGR domain protein
MPYFEFVGADKESEAAFSSKYWEIEQVGKKLTIRFGKIGMRGLDERLSLIQ